jgi:hypothetical protein
MIYLDTQSSLAENEKSLCQQPVRIPMVSGMDSPGVAVAGSLLYLKDIPVK